MNNSFPLETDVSQEKPDERLKEREAKLVRLIEALQGINQSPEWSTLKRELFDGVLEGIEGRIKNEANKPELNAPELYRLQGERKWANRYADLDELTNLYRAELANIRKTKTPGLSG